MSTTVLQAFADRRGVPADSIHGHGHSYLQNALSWYSRGWDMYMNTPSDVQTEAAAIAAGIAAVERVAARNTSLGQHKTEQVNGFVDAWKSLRS